MSMKHDDDDEEREEAGNLNESLVVEIRSKKSNKYLQLSFKERDRQLQLPLKDRIEMYHKTLIFVSNDSTTGKEEGNESTTTIGLSAFIDIELGGNNNGKKDDKDVDNDGVNLNLDFDLDFDFDKTILF